MLGYEVLHHIGQLSLFGPLESVDDMAYHHTCALHGVECVMRIHAMLVLGKERGIVYLAYVVIQSSGTHKLHIGVYAVGGIGSERTHLHRMLECTGTLLRELAENGVVDIAQLDKRDRRHKSENLLKHKHQYVGKRD